MTPEKLKAMLSDDAAIIQRGRTSAIESARRTALNLLRASTQERLNGATATTLGIRKACDDLDKIAAIELEF